MIDLWMRLLCAFIAGALLSLSGSLIQASTQNDLASPSTLGMHGLAVLLILMAHFLSFILPVAVPLEWSSLILFIFCFGLVVFFSGRNRGATRFLGNRVQAKMQKVVLLGLCFNLFVGAVFALVQFAFIGLNLKFPSQLWFGSFRFIPEGGLIVLLVSFVFLLASAKSLAPGLTGLGFGADLALGLGHKVHHLQRRALLLALFATGLLDSFFGVFSFMGLIFPHFLRKIPYFSHSCERELLQGPILCGAIFLLLDYICYDTPLYGAEIPVGLLSTVVGSLFITFLLAKDLRAQV